MNKAAAATGQYLNVALGLLLGPASERSLRKTGAVGLDDWACSWASDWQHDNEGTPRTGARGPEPATKPDCAALGKSLHTLGLHFSI